MNIMAKKKGPGFTDQERYLLDVQRRRDMAEIYPDSQEAKWLDERERLAQSNPNGPEARQIQEEMRLTSLYGEATEANATQEQHNSMKEGISSVTPEQKERVDKALGNVQLSDKIGGASEVGQKPAPNEPTPLEQSRDVGQDLHRQGVTLDQDK